ncbi:MAG: trigger factor, partial [Gammaproteobacteria bacterium]|nr:trigger factor [Gammaproteobacteria bacterium]
MQVSVETTGGLERRMTVRVPVERIEQEVESRLRTLAQQAKVAGFRPGKVPYKVVERKFGGAVRREVLGDLMQSSLREALVQEKLRPAGGPRIEPNIEAGAGLEYTATFEVYPEFSPAGLDTLKITRPAAEIGEQDVESMLEKLRRQRVAWEAVERPSQGGDRVIIDYQGDIAGAEFPGNAGENVPVVLGSGAFLKSFEDQLAGLGAGQEQGFDVVFPEDYHAKEVAGKTVHFQVKVRSVAESRLPALDDEFARAFGVTEGGVEALRKEVRDNMQRELETVIRARIKEQI